MKLLSYLPNSSRRYYKHLTITASQSCLENINSVTSCNKHIFGSKTTEKNVFKSVCIFTILGFKILFSNLNNVLLMDPRLNKFHISNLGGVAITKADVSILQDRH